MEGEQPAGRRRVFVQTETGRVLGIELDRGDNADTLKRKLQLALSLPTEQVLNNDLGAVRNDSPMLYLRRSSSTPCLSQTDRDI